MRINRRDFLKGLVGVGAACVLPLSLEKLSAKELDGAWEAACVDPFTFEVEEWGAITTPNWSVPATNAEAYGIGLGEWSSGSDLLEIADGASSLRGALAVGYLTVLDDASAAFDRGGRASLSREEKRVLDLFKESGEAAWEDWVREGPVETLRDVASAIEDWANDVFDESDLESECLSIGPYVEPYHFFNGLDWEVLEDLGVRIVDGDRPGSSYFAAELHQDVDAANQTAQELGLPIRFI